MILQSFDHFDQIAQFDPVNGSLERGPRLKSPGAHAADGWFSDLGHVSVLLYREDGGLWLGVGEERFDLTGDSGIVVRWQRGASTALLSITRGEEQCVVRYPVGPVVSADDPTPFAEDEDFDFGLFVANVLSDAERLERVRTAGQIDPTPIQVEMPPEGLR